IFGVVLRPLGVWDVAQRLQGVVEARGKPALDHPSRSQARLGAAERVSLEDSPPHPLGGGRIFGDIIAVAGKHAAGILRPSPVCRYTVTGDGPYAQCVGPGVPAESPKKRRSAPFRKARSV